MSNVPNEAPPSYEAARRGDGAPPASSGTAPASQSHDTATASSGNQRTPQRQSSMDHEIDIEQEDRPLPPGWVPQFSEEHERFFFVDTLHRGGPRAIWVHPLDDPEWLQTVPRGMDPLAYVDKLWQEHPEPSPEPSRSHLPSQQPQQHQQQQQQHSQSQQPFHGGEKILISSKIPGVSANTQAYLSTLGQPGTREGTRIVSKDELVQVTLNKMGTPEEYERKNPPSGASKLFHRKESAAQRQRRHAEHKANDLADALAYRQPYNPPLMRPSYYGPATVVRPGYGYGAPYGGGMYGGGMYGGYGYPGYNRGYGARYPGMGMSGAFLGLGAGALLGGALF